MIGWPRGLTIHLALAPVDFRKSFQGLSLEVLEGLGRDPLSGEIFVFRNRAGDKLKALYWDGQGFVLIYKRLERGRFAWPSRRDVAAQSLSVSQLQALFEGVHWQRLERPEWCHASAVV
jgi:transposase